MPEGSSFAAGYYPSCVVDFQIRFDEGSLVIGGGPKSSADIAAAGTNANAGATTPVLLDARADNLSQVLGIIPRSLTVELPGYRQAGTFNIELAYQNFPLDPRVLRSVRVFLYMGVVSAGDFGTGILEGMSEGEGMGARSSVLQASPDNLLLVGLVDSVCAEHNESGHIIRLEGRDLRGVLLDAKIDAETLTKINLAQTIDKVVGDILNKLFPQGGGIVIKTDANDWPSGLPTPALQGDLSRVNSDAATGKANVPSMQGSSQDISYWDIITQYCYLVGAIPYFVGTELRIRPPRSLYDWQRAKLPFGQTSMKTPFADEAPRTIVGAQAEQFLYRRIVFGRDILDLKFERKLTGTKVPAVRCVSVDSDLKGTTPNPTTKAPQSAKLIEARWPPITDKAANTSSVTSGGTAPTRDEITIPVPGIVNAKRLEDIAHQVYEEIGRGELGGSISTKNLASFGGDNEDPDLMKLRPGDPIEIRFDASGLESYPPPISELTNHAGRSEEEEVQAVKEQLGDENLARAIVQANRGQNTQQTFRVGNVRYQWNAGSGISVDFDFQNYVEVRSDAG